MDKNNCTRRVRDGKEWERTGKPLNLLVAATLEKAITYAFAESPIRNAEARSSTLLCSTNNLSPFNNLPLQNLKTDFSKWPIRGQKKQHQLVDNGMEWEGTGKL